MSKHSDHVLSVIAEKKEILLSELPGITELSYSETCAAIKYLKRKNKVTTKPYLGDTRCSIVVLISE